MAITTDMNGSAGHARDFTGDPGADRARQMRTALRHSLLVKLMRVGFPVLAGGSMLFYGAALYLASPPKIKGLSPGRIQISAEDLVMENPKYEGFNKDGGKYFVTSRTASQDIRQKGPVRLETITGTLTQPDKTLTDVKATRGTYDTKTSVMELYDGIDIVSQNGMRAKLSRATLDTRSSTIVSREPVKVEMPTGQVTSNQLEVHQKDKRVAFIDNVVTTLKPEQKPGAAAVEAKAKAAPGQARMVGSSDEPVTVNSSRLDIDDARKVAVFRGGVNAVQGQAAMQTEELEAYYEGQPNAAQAGGVKPATGQPGSKLNRLVSRVPVVLTNAGDRATSNAAEFDVAGDAALLLGDVVLTSGADRKATAERADINQKDDTVLLTGRNVHVVQGRNELKGRRLWVDRKAARMQLTSPGGGRVQAHFYQSESVKPGAAPKAKGANEGLGEAPVGFATFKTDPNAPIDIDADSLDVNDNAKKAVFNGKVVAVQGEFKVETAEMIAIYTGQGGLTQLQGAETAKVPKPAVAQPATQLTKIEARKGVIVTSKEQKATGQWADFDVKANTVVMGGDEVILTQGKNIVRGTRLMIDMTTGEARVLTQTPPFAPVASTGGAASPAGQPTGQGPYTPAATGRARMIVYPNEAKQAHKKARDEGKSPAEAAAAAASAATGGAWSTTDKPPAPKKDPAGNSSWDPASAFPRN